MFNFPLISIFLFLFLRLNIVINISIILLTLCQHYYLIKIPTTINKFVASIPILGDILVGKKTPPCYINPPVGAQAPGGGLIINPPLGGKIIFTTNLDGGTITPLIRNDFWSNLPPILKIGGFVDDRKSVDLLTNLYEKLQKCDWHRGKGISKRL